MTDRIKELMNLTLQGKMYVTPQKTEFDRMDSFLPEQEKDVKRICEFILNGEPLITNYSCFTGAFNFDDSVIGDAYTRIGHPNTTKFTDEFYCKSIDNLSTFDGQHGTSDYREVLAIGITGIIAKIDESIKDHSEPEQIAFLESLKKVANAFVLWIKKCSARAAEYSENVSDNACKKNLMRLSKALLNISKNPPQNFYEAVLTIYVCFSMNPDSFGTLDRYLSKFYFDDIEKGILTREEAASYLQELYLMVQARTPISSPYFTRGGQSHFCVGGRDENGKDCYNEMSQLIVDSLLELDTHIPQITFRWTNDTPKDVFKKLIAAERNDKNKRIAYTNDDRRIEAHTKICKFPYKQAVNYTMVGCNEPAMLGGMCASTSHANITHPLEYILYNCADRVIASCNFEEFYAIFKAQLYKDLDLIYHYDDLFNLVRAKDINYVSCLFLNGCIENGKSITQGGVNYAISNIMFLGNITVIDSLAIIKQFVFDEKIVSMAELLCALNSNWAGYEELHTLIMKKGKFFGNDDETSNYIAKLFYDDLYEYIKEKRTVFGYPALLGDHTGYQLHFKWFGEGTKATPDGRYSGEPLSYGIFQNNGKDRKGLTSLMNAISKFDKNGISSATVTNFNLDDSYIKNDEYFNKTVDMLETYFKNGGIQFQLNYVSKEDLLKAKKTPEKYSNLKVRVTGYSDYFTKIDEAIQDSVIRRYEN